MDRVALFRSHEMLDKSEASADASFESLALFLLFVVNSHVESLLRELSPPGAQSAQCSHKSDEQVAAAGVLSRRLAIDEPSLILKTSKIL